MLRYRSLTLLLTITLLTALWPVGGEGCRLCGKIGRCCCFTRPAAKPRTAHCAMMGGGSAACSIDRSVSRPAAFRVPQTLPERTGAFTGLLAAPSRPEPALLLTALQATRPLRLSAAPPSPPPRALRIA
jgi:hypothetical protein